LPEFTIAIDTGMRPSEQFGLRWSDVDLDRRQITLLQTKTGKPRHLPMNAACLRAFQELKARPIQGEYVLTAKDGQRLVAYRWFEDAAKDAGVAINWYEATRHTFASRLTMAGVDLRTVANLMGLSTIQMTMRYAHLAPEHQLAAVERLTPSVSTDTKTGTSANVEADKEGARIQ
jgi:integrase